MAKARQQYFADETTLQKESREFAITPDIINKLDSIETGAQVNVIETVKVNGTALVPDANKAVNVEVPNVIDNLFSTSTDDALSAKQGKVLYDYLQNIASRGRYLSNWNCVTGLAMTNPSENPYPYKAGDYYSVSNVAAIGGTNYRPNGTQYVIGQASTTVETELVSVSDFYLYDGTNWLLLANSARQIAVDSSLSTTSTNPVENRVVTNAINGKQDTLVAGTNIQIASDGVTISATDTTYSAGNNISIDANNEISATDTTYTAGANIQISNQNVISATDTVYTAGTNVQINNNVISATDTTYTAGTGISIDSNNVISNTQTSAEWGNITGTLSDQTDLQSALDAKQDDMVVLSYGHSTWQDFLNAYNKNAIVYCKASSNSNPGTGNQSRMAFMAYVSNPSSPTSVEFQYYRSRSDHDSAANQLDQVFVYQLTSSNGGTWSVIERNTAAKATAGTGINLTYSSGNMTISADAQYDNTAYGTSWDGVTNKAPTKNAVYDKISAMDTTIAGKQDTLTAGTGINIGSVNGRQGPAPDGFHIPSIAEWGGVRTIMNGLSPVTGPGDGWRMFLHMPFAGSRSYSDASLNNQGDYGNYWSSSPYGSDYPEDARYLYLDTGSAGVSRSRRAYGYSVRCFKDEYVAPDSNWTVVWGTLGSAGIFWNQSEGLISITDGSTGYTIQDKNLGATAVYGEYDTLTQANMGNMYQWGNNYGFPSTGTITNTSSTQVDASGYGPTNPYSSDTFITGNADWSSVQNDDLWGDTTGIIENVISNTGVTSVNGQTGDVTISGAVWGNITGNIADQTDLQEAISSATAGAVSDTAYGDSWDGITGIAPSKNAVYDKISAMDVTISGKANSSDVNTKTFTLSSTSDTTNATSAVNWYENGNTPIIKMTLRTEPTYFYLSYDMVTSEAGGDRHILYFKSPVRNGKYEQIVITTDTSWSVTNITESEENALSTQIAYTTKGTSTKVPTITTNTLGQVTAITETNIAFPVTSVNGQTGAVTVDISGKQDKATSGSSAPSSTPTYVGQQYVDTTNDTLYVATGTSSSSDWTEVGAGSGDMNYSDFNWASKTGATITLDLASTISPSADFTVNAPSTIKDGQTYILRVNNEGTAYEMTLGTNVTNPYDTDITLTDDGVDQFVFLAINGELELQPEGGGGGGGAITADTTGTTTSISKIWVGTEAEYQALGTYEEGIAYMTY